MESISMDKHSGDSKTLNASMNGFCIDSHQNLKIHSNDIGVKFFDSI